MFNTDECDCSCHKMGGNHMMPCCLPCPNCGKNIKTYCYDSHVHKCEKIIKDFAEKIKASENLDPKISKIVDKKFWDLI